MQSMRSLIIDGASSPVFFACQNVFSLTNVILHVLVGPCTRERQLSVEQGLRLQVKQRVMVNQDCGRAMDEVEMTGCKVETPEATAEGGEISHEVKCKGTCFCFVRPADGYIPKTSSLVSEIL